MFRDRDEELNRLEEALRDADEEEETLTDEEEYFDEDEEYDAYEEEMPLPKFRAYNSDTTDMNLEKYSKTVYKAGKGSGLGLLAFLLILLSILLFVLAWWLLKYGGFLG